MSFPPEELRPEAERFKKAIHAAFRAILAWPDEELPELRLPLKAQYFDEIRDGKKPFEYRRATAYWVQRIEGRDFSRVVLTKGYPKKGDPERTLYRAWKGAERTTIQHEHFGPEAVEVFAIDVSEPWEAPTNG